MAQFAQRLRFDLADALARHVEVFADLFERVLLALRADLIDRLASADTIEPAWLRTLADTETALATLDRGDEIRSR